MTISRFIAVKFKDEFSGDDEKAKQIREELFNIHHKLYASRPYVLGVQGVQGNQTYGKEHGYHYAFIATFESSERLKYWDYEDPDHQEALKGPVQIYFENIFVWDFPN